MSLLPKRIMIFGLPGSGKSTLATELATLLNIPVYHLDFYFFVENWEERNYEEFIQMQQELVDEENWIIDGNATRSLEMRYKRANVVLYLRFNRLLCLFRIFKRRCFRDSHVSDRPQGCPEIVRWPLIRYLWGFDRRVKGLIQDLHMRYPEVEFHELRSGKGVKEWKKSITQQAAAHKSIHDFFTLYASYFDVADIESLLRYFTYPCLMISAQHITAFSSPEEMHTNLHNLLSFYKNLGYKKVSFSIQSIADLGKNYKVATLSWVIINSSGAAVAHFLGSYQLMIDGEDIKITVVTNIE